MMIASSTSPLWRTERDELVDFKVMVERLDVDWWRNDRQQLEERFGKTNC
jgi:hypothetical protein